MNELLYGSYGIRKPSSAGEGIWAAFVLVAVADGKIDQGEYVAFRNRMGNSKVEFLRQLHDEIPNPEVLIECLQKDVELFESKISAFISAVRKSDDFEVIVAELMFILKKVSCRTGETTQREIDALDLMRDALDGGPIPTIVGPSARTIMAVGAMLIAFVLIALGCVVALVVKQFI